MYKRQSIDLAVRLDDPTRVGEVIDAAIRTGAQNLSLIHIYFFFAMGTIFTFESVQENAASL